MRRISVVTPILPVPWDRTRGWPILQTLQELARLVDLEVLFLHARYPRHPLLRPRGFPADEIPADYALPGLRVRAVPYPAVAGASRLVNGLVGAAALAGPLRQTRPDLVLSYWIYPEGASALRVARRLGRPFVVGARGSDIRVRDAWSRSMTRRVLQRADGVLVVSEELRRQAVDRYGADPARVDCVVNGCDTTLFHRRDRADCRRRLGLDPDARIVLFVGRFVEAKGLRELAAAFASLAPALPDLRLALVGDGVFRPTLERLLQEAGCGARAHLPGALDPGTVALWMGAANVLALPSYSEGYPNVLVEALACGVPVVASDVGGAREIVDPGAGRLVAARDAAGLAAALRDVLATAWDAAAISARFTRSWREVARETLAACERAAARHGGPPRA